GYSGGVGQSGWLVSAHAVALATVSSPVQCSFCSLNDGTSNHTVILKQGDLGGANLRVDGDIYVNSSNSDWNSKKGETASVCTAANKNVHNYHVCGDAFDIF